MTRWRTLVATMTLLGGLVWCWPLTAWPAGWGGIEPGESVLDGVRERYGRPTRETRGKLESYDTLQWFYEGKQAPAGMVRMIVEFGLLTPSGYRPTLVRLLRLEPKPFIFGRGTVIAGWGPPDGTGKEKDRTVYFYQSGLVVIFDEAEETATSMYFTIPQTTVLDGGEAPAPPAADAPAPPKN